MDEKELQMDGQELQEEDLQEYDLDAIIKEFSEVGSVPEPEEPAEEAQTEEEESDTELLPKEELPEVSEIEQKPETVTSDTIRMDLSQLPKGQVHIAAPVEEDDEDAQELPVNQTGEVTEETFSEGWEPEYEQPMGEYVPPQPIIFHPRSRLRELKRKLVAGPEKRYYDLSEIGLGKLQAAIFVSFLVVLLSAGATAMYAFGMVQPDRMRLMVFGQFFTLLVSALLGSFQMIEGLWDMFKGKFSLNSLLIFSFIACCADGVLCLKELRVPCCAAFSLQVMMSLWSAYHRRSTEIGQMDTMRKAVRLDSVTAGEAYYEKRKGLLRGEGQVEDFMDTYAETPKPEKVLNVYALVALVLSIGIGIAAGVLHGLSQGLQVLAVSLLAAIPASSFVVVSRPAAILERRLHSLGTVLCGWQGVSGLCGRAVFPLDFEDLLPAGSVRMNGVKFFGTRQPDEIVAYGTAVIVADGSGLSSLFTQVLDSRNGMHYDVENLRAYENGGIGGEVQGEAVLVGPLSFLREMGVEVPEGIRVSGAVCVAIDGELSGLFAVTCEKNRSSWAGLATLCAYRGLKPVLVTGDFTLTPGFIRSRFGVNPRKLIFPERAVREQLRQKQAEPGQPALLLTTAEGLAPVAYGVTGARALRTSARLGVVVHMIGGIVGLLMMLALALLGAMEYLTPANMFLYHLVWMLPGLLITEWTRSI